MQIFIHPIREPGKDESEWTIIELQGELNSENFCNVGGRCIGDLHYNAEGSPLLIIGHHILYGKEQKLEKPFAVLQKQTSSSERSDLQYNVISVIKKKLIFRDRPKPIVSLK